MVRQCRSWPATHCRGRAESRRDAGLCPGLPDGSPPRLSGGRSHRPLAPNPLNHVFFCNSGSEAGDTALKIAIAYHRLRGEGTRTRLIGRERAYHGVGFGGISVGGISGNRKLYGSLLTGVDHLPTRSICVAMLSHAACPSMVPNWLMIWSASSPCMTPRISPLSSSSRWPGRPAFCLRPRAISSACARSAPGTASC